MATGKVLVVDDEVYIVQILDFSFGMEGYQVITALNGQEGLEKAKAEKPDLIVMDILMPVMDGLDACRALKANPTTADIPIVLLSSQARSADRAAGFDAGADDYITKPFSVRKLTLRVNAILGQSSEL